MMKREKEDFGKEDDPGGKTDLSRRREQRLPVVGGGQVSTFKAVSSDMVCPAALAASTRA